MPSGSSQAEGAGPSLKATIDRSLISARGGLVYLESSLEESELPLTVVEASNSIFSTAGLAPLLRVDGQGQAERLRDRILYKAERSPTTRSRLIAGIRSSRPGSPPVTIPARTGEPPSTPRTNRR